MHDANGTPLKKGDHVLIPAVVTELNGGPDYCNVSVETLLGRRPDGKVEHISAINTAVLIKTGSADESGGALPVVAPGRKLPHEVQTGI